MQQIKTERLVLRPRVIDLHIPKEVGWLNDPFIMKYSEQRHIRHTIASQIAYISSFGGRDLLYGIHCGDQQLVGSISAHVDSSNSVANVGILIGDAYYWRAGVGSEAWSAFSTFLFEGCFIRKIEAGCMDLNEGMKGICLKSGMKEEGRLKSHFIVDGGYSDLVQYGKINELSK